jgi:hypothetical protein
VNVDNVNIGTIVDSYPDSTISWSADVHNTVSTATPTLTATTYVVCASP